MTELQKSLKGADNAKSKTVHSFDSLSQEGVHALINDITTIFIYYCRGNFIFRSKDSETDFQSIELGSGTNYHIVTMPKTIIENTDRCKDYILQFVLGFSGSKFDGDKQKTSEIDGWAEQFLSIMFEGKSIKSFNAGMFLASVKEQQDGSYFKILEIRWNAIQEFFLGNVEKCVKHLSEALTLAKEQDQPI